jgi:HK97 family phage major capsid protein
MLNISKTRSAPIFGSPLLIKEDPDPADPVKAMNDLTAGFGEFKKQQESKLADIETKAAGVAKLGDRLDKIEARLNRPDQRGGNSADADAMERKAIFRRYLTLGFDRLDDADKKALNAGTPADGGYITAPEYSSQIIDKLTEFSPMRSLSNVMSIGGDKVYIPTVTSPLSGSWVTETGSRPESQPVFDQVEIAVFEHAVIVPVTDRLMEDSVIDLMAFLSAMIGTQFGKSEAAAFVSGDGNGKPTGFLESEAVIDQVEVDQSAATSALVGGILDTFYAVPSAYAARGTWLANRRTIAFIRKALDSSEASVRSLWGASLADGAPPTLCGRPIVEAVDMPDWVSADSPSSDTFPLAFGDWATAYRIVDRTGVKIMQDPYTGSDNGYVKLRARMRVGGKVVQPDAIALLKATT